MLDPIANNAGIIIFILVIMWIAQFGMAYLQMRRFYKRLVTIRKGGLTAVGLEGGRYRGRAYAVLTVDDDDIVIHAEQFTGWTVFARLHPVPEILGMSLSELLAQEDHLPVSPKLRGAFGNAARDLQEAREDGVAKESPIPAA